MPPSTGARQRQRAETMQRLKDTARQHLAEHGAAALSLRSVARDLGIVSSAVYRYVASRDELLTLLIIDAYDAIGDTAEQAAAASVGAPPAERWRSVAQAVRTWAVAHPHEYSLIYGSPVPGYAAPTDTVAPAGRVIATLLEIVTAARPPAASIELPPSVDADLTAIATTLDTDLAPATLARAITAWTQLFGLISFEVFGQTRNGITDHAALLDVACAEMTNLLGLA